jgi:hypothetical protein
VAEAAVEEDVEAAAADRGVAVADPAADMAAVVPPAATAAERDPAPVRVAPLRSVNHDPVHRAAA